MYDLLISGGTVVDGTGAAPRTIEAPFARDDLPTGATRVLQPSTGYLKTIVGGVVVRDDADTGERPGRLVRSGR